MIKEFKFLQKIREPRKSVGVVKLKEEFNRNKHLIFLWSEYPYDGDDSNLITFEGNILQFYNLTRGNSPTIYEIYIKEPGYFDSCIVFNLRHVLSKFIRRKAKLTIIYSNQ
jgi:hypothetical protein